MPDRENSQKEMGAGIAASPHCAERRICRCSWPGQKPEGPDPLSILAHQLRRRFLSGSSLVRGARPIYLTARPEGSLVLRSVRPANPDPKTPGQNHPMFHGPSWGDHSPRPALLTEIPKNSGNRVARQEDCLFRRLIPADPEKNPKALPTACRRRSDLWSPAAPSCRCRLSGEAGTAVPITHAPCTRRPSRKSEKCGGKPVDNGDIGHNRRNLFTRRRIGRSGCRSVPLRLLRPKCLNCLRSTPEPPYLAGPQSAAARGGADDRGAGAGPCRRRHRQDRRADRPARPSDRHPPRLAEPDPRRHLHQQGRARNEGARRRIVRRRGRGHAVARHLPLGRRADAAQPRRARRPPVQLHHPRHRRSAARPQAADPGRRTSTRSAGPRVSSPGSSTAGRTAAGLPSRSTPANPKPSPPAAAPSSMRNIRSG